MRSAHDRVIHFHFSVEDSEDSFMSTLTEGFLSTTLCIGNLRSRLLNKIICIMNFKPLSHHLFLEPLEEEKTTKSGIVLPDSAEREKPIKGKVLAVGPGKMNDKGERVMMSVKVGDVVLFKKYGPDEIELEGKKYLVGDEDDILAVVE